MGSEVSRFQRLHRSAGQKSDASFCGFAVADDAAEDNWFSGCHTQGAMANRSAVGIHHPAHEFLAGADKPVREYRSADQ